MYLKLYFTFIVLFVIFNVSTAGIAVTRPNKGKYVLMVSKCTSILFLIFCLWLKTFLTNLLLKIYWGHPNKCWDGAREYSVGAHQMEGSCAQFVCGSDFLGELQMYPFFFFILEQNKKTWNQKFYIFFFILCRCGLATVNGKLTLPDLSKKYPECCPGRWFNVSFISLLHLYILFNCH